MKHNIYIYIAVMTAVTYLIRVLPLTLIRKKITNVTLRSFLYYVPYVTLAIMTFPAIINSTGSIWSGLAALVIGVLLSYFANYVASTCYFVWISVFHCVVMTTR